MFEYCRPCWRHSHFLVGHSVVWCGAWCVARDRVVNYCVRFVRCGGGCCEAARRLDGIARKRRRLEGATEGVPHARLLGIIATLPAVPVAAERANPFVWHDCHLLPREQFSHLRLIAMQPTTPKKAQRLQVLRSSHHRGAGRGIKLRGGNDKTSRKTWCVPRYVLLVFFAEPAAILHAVPWVPARCRASAGAAPLFSLRSLPDLCRLAEGVESERENEETKKGERQLEKRGESETETQTQTGRKRPKQSARVHGGVEEGKSPAKAATFFLTCVSNASVVVRDALPCNYSAKRRQTPEPRNPLPESKHLNSGEKHRTNQRQASETTHSLCDDFLPALIPSHRKTAK